MKKDAYKRIDAFRFVDDFPQNFHSLCEEDDVEKSFTAVDSLIAEIYAPDPRTGLPTGDIGYYVSDKANPEIKQFILEQLFMDTSSVANPKAPVGMSEDDILSLSRFAGESPHDYMARLNSEIDIFRRINEEYAKLSVSEDGVSVPLAE